DLFVHRMRAHRRAARTPLIGPEGLREDAGIGEECDARTVAEFEYGWLAGLGNIGSGADDPDPVCFEVRLGLEKGLRAPVHAVIARHGDDVESGASQRGSPVRTRQHRMARLGQTHTAIGKAGFELPENDVRPAQYIASGRKTLVINLTVHREIACRQYRKTQDPLPFDAVRLSRSPLSGSEP